MDRNKIRLVVIHVLIVFIANSSSAKTFATYVKAEPSGLNPAAATSGESFYIISTLFRGLTRYTDEGILIFENAKSCRYIIDTDVRCKLRADIKYSDGSPITAHDYAEAFKGILHSQKSVFIAPLLFSIRNAKKVYLKEAATDTLGIKALSNNEIQFLLEAPDRDFLKKLSHPLLFPYKGDGSFNGPYKLAKVVKGKKWILEPNLYYKSANPKRPQIEISFIPSDSTAVDLYHKGKIDFLWRLPTTELNTLDEKREDLFKVDLSRYDYVGFNLRDSSPLKDIQLRKKLAQSIDPHDFKRIFHSKGGAGCPGLSDHFLQENPKRCQPKQEVNEKITPPLHLKMYYSLLGGVDIERQAAWFQNQWKEKLGVRLQVKGMEHKSLNVKLREDPPDIFRKGVSLNRPSCLAALESFQSDHPENHTGFKNPKFDEMIKPLQNKKLSRIEQDTICAAAHDFLFKEEYVGIPLGRIYFSMLLNPQFRGVKVNELNQLDLSELEYVERK